MFQACVRLSVCPAATQTQCNTVPTSTTYWAWYMIEQHERTTKRFEVLEEQTL